MPGPALERLTALYADYQAAADSLLHGRASDDAALRSVAQRVLEAIDSLVVGHQNRLNQRLEAADVRARATIRWTLILSVTGFLLAVGVAGYFVYSISRAVNKLRQATHRIAEGDFNFDPRIPIGD